MNINRETTAKQISTNLAELIRSAGITQTDLARSAGISDMAISRIMRCVHEPKATVLIKLARALDVSVDAILFPPQKRRSQKSA